MMNLKGKRILVLTGFNANVQGLINCLKDWDGEVEAFSYDQKLPARKYSLCFAVLGENNASPNMMVQQIIPHLSEDSKKVLLAPSKLSYRDKTNWKFNAYLQAPVHRNSLQVILKYLLSTPNPDGNEDAKSNKKKKCLKASTTYFREVAPSDEGLRRKLILLCLENIYQILDQLAPLAESLDKEEIQTLLHRLRYCFACLGRSDLEKILSKLKLYAQKNAAGKNFQKNYRRLWLETSHIVTYLLMSEDF